MTEFGARHWWAYTRAVRDPRRIRALLRATRLLSPARRVLAGYLFRRGDVAAPVWVRTPLGETELRLRHPHDYATLVEVVGEEAYLVTVDDRVVVDVGANIGVFSVYALTRHPKIRVHAIEPAPANLAVLAVNLAGFAGRTIEHPVAAAVESGPVAFGIEPTGRYGGIGVDTDSEIVVDGVAIGELLDTIFGAEGRIDVLKVDVEGFERELLEAVPSEQAQRIGRVVVEWSHPDLDTLEPWAALGFRVSGGPHTWTLERAR